MKTGLWVVIVGSLSFCYVACGDSGGDSNSKRGSSDDCSEGEGACWPVVMIHTKMPLPVEEAATGTFRACRNVDDCFNGTLETSQYHYVNFDGTTVDYGPTASVSLDGHDLDFTWFGQDQSDAFEDGDRYSLTFEDGEDHSLVLFDEVIEYTTFQGLCDDTCSAAIIDLVEEGSGGGGGSSGG